MVNVSRKIAVIAGDGIGREVIPAALEVARASGAAVDITELDRGDGAGSGPGEEADVRCRRFAEDARVRHWIANRVAGLDPAYERLGRALGEYRYNECS